MVDVKLIEEICYRLTKGDDIDILEILRRTGSQIGVKEVHDACRSHVPIVPVSGFLTRYNDVAVLTLRWMSIDRYRELASQKTPNYMTPEEYMMLEETRSNQIFVEEVQTIEELNELTDRSKAKTKSIPLNGEIFCRSVGPGGTSIDFYATKENVEAIWTNENCPYLRDGNSFKGIQVTTVTADDRGAASDLHNVSYISWGDVAEWYAHGKKLGAIP